MSEAVNIYVDKPSCLVDEVIVIAVSGVEPHSLVTVVATLTDQAGFYSYATYQANEYGMIDVSKTLSISGTYTGVEAMGLVWSMIQQPGQKPGRRLLKLDVTTPLVTTLAAFAGALDGAEAFDDEFREKYCLASCTCERWYLAEGVERIPLTGGRLQGTLFIPRGEGPFPGVVDIFGDGGGTVEHRAALLASRGIASIALCYSVPVVVKELEYFVSAVNFLLAHPKVSSQGAGVIGVCKGSEMAYLLSIVCPKVYACIIIAGFDSLFDETKTYQDEIFHTDKNVRDIYVKTLSELQSPGLRLLPAEMCERPNTQASIPVERAVNARFLIAHGLDDRFVPSLCAKYVTARLKSHGKSNYTLVLYPGTGHLLEPPYAPHTYSSYNKYFNVHLKWGGNAKQHADAQADLWTRMQEFIHGHIPLCANSHSKM